MKNNPMPFVECHEDHMHVWEATMEGFRCIGELAMEISGVHPVMRGEVQDAEMSYIIESIEWSYVRAPVLKSLAEMVANAKKEIVAEVESSVLADLPDDPVGLAEYQPTTYKWWPMLTWAEAAALHEEKKDLYGCHRNFISMRAALQDLNMRTR